LNYNALKEEDPEVFSIMLKEVERQRSTLGLIASENFVEESLLEAVGTVFTNKYAEGYPGKRYYAGNEFVDEIENLAIERAKKLFNAEHANVQPNAGSPANMAAYFALIKPGEKIMGMRLDQGGHLTHGSPVNFSGKLFQTAYYGVDPETHLLDYDEIRKKALEEKPNLIVCGATVYPRVIDFKAFKGIADEVGAFLVADIAHIAGLVAGGQHPSPVPYADVVTMTTHKTLRGPRSGLILCKKEHAKAVDKAVFPGIQGGPLVHVIAAKAVCFKKAMTKEFKEYSAQVVNNAKALADSLIENGLKLITGGTDNHLMLVDVTPLGLTGTQAQNALEKAGIVVNRNTIPYDKRSPFDPSGIRIGTPALTSRGMKEGEMREIGELITKILKSPDSSEVKEKVKQRVLELCSEFPLYNELIF